MTEALKSVKPFALKNNQNYNKNKKKTAYAVFDFFN